MIVRDLGRAEYVPTWQAMRHFTQERDASSEDQLWLVEHTPVYTLGQAGRREHLRSAGEIPIVATDRGGQVTFHGPGQVVAYPLVDLRRRRIFVKELVFRIEQSVIQTLESYGVDARRVRGAPGVFVPWSAATSQGEFTGLAKSPRWHQGCARLQLPRRGAECRDGSHAICLDRSVRLRGTDDGRPGNARGRG